MVMIGRKAFSNGGPNCLRESHNISQPNMQQQQALKHESRFDTVRSFLKEVVLLNQRGLVTDYPSQIWNSDKTGFFLGMTSKKILARCGDRCVSEIGGASDNQFKSVNVCSS